jgi:predicted transcriptional regulator
MSTAPQIKPEETENRKTLTKKWGEEIMAVGFTAVPDILLKRMAVLGITPMEMMVLLQILSYWWSAEQLPFPSKAKIAVAIGCHEKTVQQAITRLVKLGFIRRQERRRAEDRNESNIYDFSPLIEILKPEAVKEAAEQEAHREKKLQRMKPPAKRKLVAVKT